MKKLLLIVAIASCSGYIHSFQADVERSYVSSFMPGTGFAGSLKRWTYGLGATAALYGSARLYAWYSVDALCKQYEQEIIEIARFKGNMDELCRELKNKALLAHRQKLNNWFFDTLERCYVNYPLVWYKKRLETDLRFLKKVGFLWRFGSFADRVHNLVYNLEVIDTQLTSDYDMVREKREFDDLNVLL